MFHLFPLELQGVLKPLKPHPDPCLTCPPFEVGELGVKEFFKTQQNSLEQTRTLMKRLEPNLKVQASAAMFVDGHEQTRPARKVKAAGKGGAKPRKK